MPERPKMPRRQALMIAAFISVGILAGVAVRLPLLWQWVIAIAMLVLTGVAFVLLWRTKPDDPRDNRKFILQGYIFFLPLFALTVVVFALAKAHVLQRFGLDGGTAFLLGICVLLVFFTPPFLLLRRKQQRELQRLMTDGEKQREEEFKQTIRTIPRGWGMRPEEATKRGHMNFWLGIVIGGGFSAGAGAIAIYLGPHGWKGIIYCACLCLMAINAFYFGISQGFGLWRAGRRWREQATGTVTIQGIFVDQWIEEGMSNKTGHKTLVKIQRKDGSSKILPVGEEFDEAMPEVGEEVHIEYLFGCEAVTDVEPLPGGRGSVPSAPFPLRGGSQS